jgi:hypothetical protein
MVTIGRVLWAFRELVVLSLLVLTGALIVFSVLPFPFGEILAVILVLWFLGGL